MRLFADASPFFSCADSFEERAFELFRFFDGFGDVAEWLVLELPLLLPSDEVAIASASRPFPVLVIGLDMFQ